MEAWWRKIQTFSEKTILNWYELLWIHLWKQGRNSSHMIFTFFSRCCSLSSNSFFSCWTMIKQEASIRPNPKNLISQSRTMLIHVSKSIYLVCVSIRIIMDNECTFSNLLIVLCALAASCLNLTNSSSKEEAFACRLIISSCIYDKKGLVPRRPNSFLHEFLINLTMYNMQL